MWNSRNVIMSFLRFVQDKHKNGNKLTADFQFLFLFAIHRINTINIDTVRNFLIYIKLQHFCT